MLFLGKYHLANFLPLCNTWSALVVPFSLLTHIIITKTFCLCFNDFMLVTDRQVMWGGCGAQQVFSRAPFHRKLVFHSYCELQEARFSDVGGLSQPLLI